MKAFLQQAGQLLLKSEATRIQAKDDLTRLFVHHRAVSDEQIREGQAYGFGLPDPAAFRRPYGEPGSININNTQAPEPKKGGWLKGLATAALIGTGGGGIAMAGTYGAYTLLKDQLAPKVTINPGQWKANWKMDADKGLQIGEIQPEPPK